MEAWREELYHHGIIGQKWGKRNGPPYPLTKSQMSFAEKKESDPMHLRDTNDAAFKSSDQIKAHLAKKGFKQDKHTPDAMNKTFSAKDARGKDVSVDFTVFSDGFFRTSPRRLDMAIQNVESNFQEMDRYARKRLANYIDKEDISKEWLGVKKSGKEIANGFNTPYVTLDAATTNMRTEFSYDGGEEWGYHYFDVELSSDRKERKRRYDVVMNG